MSSGLILLLVLIAVAISIVIGTKFNVNMGLVAFVCAVIIGSFFLGIKPRVLATYWPTSVVIQIIGVTFFYGFVNETGAIIAITKRIMYRAQNQLWLLPLVIFVITAGLGYIGVNPMGINALMLPIIAGICMYTNRSPFCLFLCYGAASTAGLLSPLGSAGIVASGLITSAMSEVPGGMLTRMYINNFLVALIAFAIYYIAFRCWGLKAKDEYKAVIAEKPEKMTKQQKQVLIIMLIVIAIFIFFGVTGITVVTNALDVGWVYALAGIICACLKIADQRTVIQKHIPWGIILLVSGFTILLSLLTEYGATELIANVINNNVSNVLIAPLLGILAGITSLFSDSIGVVLPLYIPICASVIAENSSVSAASVMSAAVIGGLSTGSAPISTGGAMVMSFTPETMKKKMFWILFGAAFINLAIVFVLSIIGLFG